VAEPIASLLVPIWREAIPLSPPAFAHGAPAEQDGEFVDGVVEVRPEAAVRESQRPLSCYPVVSDGVVVFSDGAGIRAADLETGKPAVTSNGMLYRSESSEEKTQPILFTGTGGVAHGVPRLTLDVADGIVFARVGTLATSHAQASQASAGDRIIGLDLRREGLLTFRPSRDDGAWSFDGTPVSDGRRVYVAMRHSEVTPHAYVACFDATTGVQKWRTSIGSADTPAGGAGDEITHNLLTLVENRIYFNTNLGLVAAIDADTGEICWLSRYDRLSGKSLTVGSAGPLHLDRDPSPCLYHEGLLLVTPSDLPAIFAMDANTGKMIWQNDSFPDALHLLAVRGADLIVSGNRLAALDAASGRVNWVWPESEHAGIRGIGRGVVAGNEVFWPTRDAIYVVEAKSGGQTRSPISLAPESCGANVIVAEGRLVVAGYDKLMVFGSPDDRSVTKTVNNISRKDAKSPRKELGGN
jgi:outer membrane protein assembly factor BamB